MVALVGDHAWPVPPFPDAEQNGLRGQRPFRNAPQTLDADDPVGLDLADDQAKLVHVREEHHARRAGCPLDRRNQIALTVSVRFEAKLCEHVAETLPHTALMAA